ncbi:light and oxygen sensing histidine kinase [Haloferax mucosum ATCC BAA-1512]|uniref:histidine kinase n=1 Tax=Haloferax mucosum ATCC BAA-1512 TaxID=662479 RepID=M0IIW2_9EURY|nr:ATP-binding protein [Haloferax mucosum]ELZ95803.1 light and oxygen sensing histidine kinase [Haloferax mucosum ATCC BAA-1512]
MSDVDAAGFDAERESKLLGVLAASRRLFRQLSVEAVASVAVDEARQIFGLELVAVRLLDDGALAPISYTAGVVDVFGGDPPAYPRDDSVVWTAFETGETQVVADTTQIDALRGLPVGSGVVVPLGDQGVFTAFSRERAGFSETDVRLLELLALAVAEALWRVKRDEQLVAAETRLELAVDGTGTGIWEWDLVENELVVHRSAATVFGYDPPSDKTYLTVTEHLEDLLERIHPADVNPVVERIANALETGTVGGGIEFRAWTGQEWRWLLARGQLEHGSDGDPVVMRGVVSDITDLQTVETELRRTSARLEAILEAVTDVVIIYDADGTIRFVSESVTSVLGYEPEELIGTKGGRYIHPDDVSSVLDVVEKARASKTRERIRYRMLAADGTWRFVESIGNGEPIAVGGGYATSTRDVTQQVRHERALETLQTRTSDLMQAETVEDAAHEAVAIASEAFGLPLTAVWRYDADSDTLIPIAETPQVRSVIGPAPVFDRSRGVVWDAFDSGTVQVHPNLRSNPDVYDPETAIETEVIAPLGDFGVLITAATETNTFSERDKALVEILATTVTAAIQNTRRKRELTEARRLLERSNEDLQQFAYIASHDLKEPLRTVSSYLSLLESSYDIEAALGSDAVEFVSYATEAAERMQEMVTALLQYSRVETHANVDSTVELDEALELAMLNLTVRIEEAGASVTTDDLPTVVGDLRLLVQLFQNLLDNAIKYNDSETPTVSISATIDDGRCEVTVADNGVGIEESMRERAFDVFERLDGRVGDGGTGIGLTLCRRIVERHGGDIRLDDAAGGGTAVKFSLPLAEVSS